MSKDKIVKKTGILFACSLGSASDVKRQIEMGCDIHEKDGFGVPAIIIAARMNYMEIIKLLVGAGVEINTRSPQGETVKLWAERHNNHQMLEFVRTRTPRKIEFNNRSHYIISNRDFTHIEIEQLNQILTEFPHASEYLGHYLQPWKDRQHWVYRFMGLDLSKYSSDLLCIAANAYDSCGNTMLGVAAEYGKSVAAVQKLIDLGARLDTPDHNMNKLALHWAINNKLSCRNKSSMEAVAVVKCLLDNGANIKLDCYQGETPFDYAKSRGFTAAARLIQEKIPTLEFTNYAVTFLLQDFLIPSEIALCIASLLSPEDGKRVACTSNYIYTSTNREYKNYLDRCV